MNRSEYTIAESRLIEGAESIYINQQILEMGYADIIAFFGKDNILTKAINFFKNLAAKYGPIMDAVIKLMKDLRPLVFNGNKFELPSKFNVIKWVKIGWKTAAFIINIVKILNK